MLDGKAIDAAGSGNVGNSTRYDASISPQSLISKIRLRHAWKKSKHNLRRPTKKEKAMIQRLDDSIIPLCLNQVVIYFDIAIIADTRRSELLNDSFLVGETVLEFGEVNG